MSIKDVEILLYNVIRKCKTKLKVDETTHYFFLSLAEIAASDGFDGRV